MTGDRIHKGGPFTVMMVAAATVIVFTGIYQAAAIITPLLLALLLAMVCQPILNAMEKIKIPRWLGGCLVLGAVVLIGLLLGKIITNTGIQLMEKMPYYQKQSEAMITELTVWLANYHVVLDPKIILQNLDPQKAFSVALITLSGVGGALSAVFLLLLVVVFMLMEAEALPAKFAYLWPNANKKTSPLNQFVDSVESYLLIKTGTSALTGICVAVALSILDVNYALLWGVLAFLLNFIPTIGSILAAIPAILISLIDGGVALCLWTTGVFVVINMLIGNVLEPRVMGKGLGLSPLVVMLSLLVWGALLGPVGMLMSIPLTMVVKIGLSAHQDLAHWSVLLSDEVPQQSEDEK